MTDASISFACIVSSALGGRIFVEAGDKGTLDRQISGFVSGVVNKRPDLQGSFAQGPISFSYLKGQDFSFVVIAPSTIEVDVIWSFLLELSSLTKGQAAAQPDQEHLTKVLNQLLEEYKGITKKSQLKPKNHPSKSATIYSSYLLVLQSFVQSVIEKTNLRSPDVDPVTNFFRAVGESYNEQGGTESVSKTFNAAAEATKEKMQKIEADISQEGISTFVKHTLEKAEKNALELGGAIMDGAAKIEMEAQKSGGYSEYIKKEIVEVEAAVAPIASQVSTALVEAGAQAGGLLMDGIEKIGKDVEEKGGIQNYLKAESENALAVGIQVGTVLANNATVFGQEVQTKGFSAAISDSWVSLTKSFSKPKDATSNSGFDEESF